MTTLPPLQRFERGAVDLGAVLSQGQLAQFDRFLAELQKWNRRINLTSAQTLDELISRHALDSLAGLRVLHDLPINAQVADLGSGAGFPGLPIKIARPELRMTLIEPRQKRSAFLTTVCALLALPGVTVAETTIDPKHPLPDLAGRFDAVLMRAVADPLAARDLALPLVMPGGKIVIWASTQQAERVGAEFDVVRYHIPTTDISHALFMWRVR